MKVLTILAILVGIVGAYLGVAAARDLPPFSPAAAPDQSTAQSTLTSTPSPTPGSTPTPTPTPTVVTTIEMGTDSSWKSLDASVQRWTSVTFDDSWWPDSWESDSPISGLKQGRAIWYAETPIPLTAYFRRSFEISGVEVISGRIHVKICAYGEGIFTIPDMGKVYIYINDQYVDKVTSGGYMNNWWREKDLDITSYLTLGKNVIAVKVEFDESATEPPTVSKYNWWALDTTIRYTITQ
jgi:hypothetical protein